MRKRSSKKVCGEGINDATYATSRYENNKLVWRCPFYQQWFNMINRVYGKRDKELYGDVIVCPEWLTFSNFKSWMATQDWEGKQLDKDLMGNGLVYSPDSCAFLPRRINQLITEVRKNNSGIPNILYEGRGWVGYYSYDKGVVLRKNFDNKESAINFWIDGKIRIIKEEEGLERRVYLKLLERYESLRKKYLEM